MKIDYGTKIKAALVEILNYSIQKQTNPTKLYELANEALHKCTGNGSFSPARIDALSKSFLLPDKGLVEKLEETYKDNGRKINTTSFGSIYRLLSKHNYKMVLNSRCKIVGFEKIIIPRKRVFVANLPCEKIVGNPKTGKAFRNNFNERSPEVGYHR